MDDLLASTAEQHRVWPGHDGALGRMDIVFGHHRNYNGNHNKGWIQGTDGGGSGKIMMERQQSGSNSSNVRMFADRNMRDRQTQ